MLLESVAARYVGPSPAQAGNDPQVPKSEPSIFDIQDKINNELSRLESLANRLAELAG